MTDKRQAVEDFCAEMRAVVPGAVKRFTQGDCYRFHLMLKERWPQAKPWYDRVDAHVLTELYGRLYDITGWVWSAGREPPHVVQWHELEEYIRDAAPEWKYEG